MSGDPPKAGLFGWWGQNKPIPNQSAVSDEPMASLSVPEMARRASKARKDSSSMSHDEALNISRANSKPGPSSPELPNAPGRARSNSKYDKLGLMAAYSAGPSSF